MSLIFVMKSECVCLEQLPKPGENRLSTNKKRANTPRCLPSLQTLVTKLYHRRRDSFCCFGLGHSKINCNTILLII